MPEDKISPEEKLLTLIREQKEDEEKKEPALPKKKRFKLLKKVNRTPYSIKPLLITIIVILFGVIIYESRFEASSRNRIVLPPQDERGHKNKEIEPINLKPYSYYSQALEGKSIFSPLVMEKPALGITATGGEKIETMCKNYQLKGVILSGEKPEAVIEDSQSRRTLTVGIGDTIGKVQVIDIKEGRVILGYENETYNLVF